MPVLPGACGLCMGGASGLWARRGRSAWEEAAGADAACAPRAKLERRAWRRACCGPGRGSDEEGPPGCVSNAAAAWQCFVWRMFALMRV
jgi:hypothetical protein